MFRFPSCWAVCLLVTPVFLCGQAPAGGQAPPTPKAAAPIDLTGYWVSLVTEDWRYRMVTPPKGDFAAIPLNAEGRKVAGAWDPAKDESAGDQCKAYGAAAIMRVPTRLHITWENDNTLRIDTDAGSQTRMLNFGTATAQGGGWQGISAASWDTLRSGRGGTGPVLGGSLKVVTTKMKPGYLRKNGVPYSANTVLTEYYDRTTERNGEVLLVVTTIVDDPQYLNQQFITSTHFKKLPDATGWNPTPCSAR
jgi:hypothetical protein